MLLALLLPAQFAMAQTNLGSPKEPITAAMLGSAPMNDFKDLYQISLKYVDNICLENGRNIGCW
jgi:hypothetical protein